MLLRYISTACITLSFALLPGPAPAGASQQDDQDREARTREYVKVLVVEVDQWTKDFPRDFYMAATRPPVDSSKLSESVKAGAEQLGDTVKQLAALGKAQDVLNNAEFRNELNKTLAAAKQVNAAMGSQRFPGVLQNKWDEIRTDLNSLAQVYKLETLAYLAPPAPGRAGATVAAAVPGGIVGYIVDQSCALKGKGMWTNATCIARCIRDGDKAVLVTEQGKIYQIANPDKIDSDAYGLKVTLVGKMDSDTITIASLMM